MKKTLIIIGFILLPSVAFAGFWSDLFGIQEEPVFGAPSQNTFQKGLLPISDSTYYIGTTTPSVSAWSSVIADSFYDTDASDGCAEWSSNVLTSTGVACGAGAASYFGDLLDVATSSDATGDIYYLNSSGQLTNLGIGAESEVLTVGSGLPSWAVAAGGGSDFAWTTETNYGETVNSTSTPIWLKDTLYASSTVVIAGNTKIGEGTPTWADGINDLYVKADAEVQGDLLMGDGSGIYTDTNAGAGAGLTLSSFNSVGSGGSWINMTPGGGVPAGDLELYSGDENDSDITLTVQTGVDAVFKVASTTVAFNKLTNCDTIDTDANGVFSCGTDGTGSGGTGTISTSTVPTVGHIPYWTSSGAWPETLGSVATSSPTLGTNLSYSGTLGDLIGGADGTLTIDDVFVLLAGDTMTGTLTFDGAATDITTANADNLTLIPGGAGILELQAGSGGINVETTSGNSDITINPHGTGDVLLPDGFISQASSTVTGLFNFANATGTQLTLTDLTSCDTIDTDANGFLVCGTDAGAGFGQAWEIDGAGFLAPTTTITTLHNNGFLSQASSTIVGDLSVTGTSTIDGLGTGSNGDYDLILGNGSNYGGLKIGNVGIYSSSFSAGGMDLDKAVLFRQEGNIGVGNDPGIEFAWMEGGNTARMLIPESGAGNATNMIRSVIVAGPYSQTLGNDNVLCSNSSWNFWAIDCDTGGTGPDFGVLDDFQVLGDIYTGGSITASSTVTVETTTATSSLPQLDVADIEYTGGLYISADYITDFAGTGLSVTGGVLNAEVQTSDLHDAVTVTDTDTINLTLAGQDIQADGLYTAGSGLTLTTADFSCDTANAATFGCLTAANWTLFNNKVSTTSIDTEVELESLLTDVTDVFTNNDGSLADDDLTDDTLTTLSDVDTTGVAASNILMWSGSNWIDQATSTEMLQDLVTLAGTPNYLTISGQVITQNKLDISDDTNATGGTGITISANDFSIDFTEFDTDNITEGAANFYYTQAQFDADIIASTTVPNLACANGQIMEFNTTGSVWECGDDDTGGAGVWTDAGTYLNPTNGEGILVNNATSTITNLDVTNGTTTNATSTNLYVSSVLGVASSTPFGRLSVDVADTENLTGLIVRNLDTTNDPLTAQFIKSANGGNDVSIERINDATGGGYLEFYHNSATPAVSDSSGIEFYANNSAGARHLQSQIYSGWNTTTAGSEDGYLLFGVTDAGNTFTDKLLLDQEYNGLLVGDANADAYVVARGNHALVLQTDNDQSKITIKDGAGADILLEPNGTGNVGIATTSPYAKLGIEQGTELFSFLVGNTGSTTPSLAVEGVNGNGNVQIGTALEIGGAEISDFAGTGLSVTAGVLNAEVQTSDLHDAVTMSGTPNYITLSGQDIVRAKLDISDDTNATGDEGIDITTNSFTLNLNEITTDTLIAAGDLIAFTDITDSGNQNITFANFEALLSLGNLLGDSDDITEGATNLFNQTHTSEVTGATALTIASNVVDSDNITNDTILALDLSTTTVFLDGELLSYVAATDNFTSLTCAEITGSADLCDGNDAGGGGGSGNVATSTNETAGRVPYWTSTSGTPATLGEVATTTITDGTGLTFSAGPGYLLGGANTTLSVDASQTQVTAVGALNGGSITSGFGSINNGASTIDTTGDVSFGGTTVNTGSTLTVTDLTSALTLTGAGGIFAEYTGTSCTNQFIRSLSALGVATCESVANADLTNSTISGISLGSNLNALTATDSTLTFSGSYDGSTARTVGLNLGNANTWSALQTFGDLTVTGELLIPNATNPTVATAGELAINTTSASSSVRYHDGTEELALYSSYDRSFSFASSTLSYMGDYGAAASTTILLSNPYRPTKLLSFYCKTDSGTAYAGFGDGNATTTQANCSTSGAEVAPASNNTWNMRENFFIELGRTTGSPSTITVTATLRDEVD